MENEYYKVPILRANMPTENGYSYTLYALEQMVSMSDNRTIYGHMFSSVAKLAPNMQREFASLIVSSLDLEDGTLYVTFRFLDTKSGETLIRSIKAGMNPMLGVCAEAHVVNNTAMEIRKFHGIAIKLVDKDKY
jgi:hypothetical protein